MVKIRKADERGKVDMGWLKSQHTFSFGSYQDESHMGFRDLRVINEDRVMPSEGFDPHSHKDMEIISYVLDGALEHKDSMGTGSVIRQGDVQRMSAGTGVEHSEFNHSKTEKVHFLQIWIFPESKNLKPGYEQKSFGPSDKKDRLCLILSREGREKSLKINADVDIFASLLSPETDLSYELPPNRAAWVQVTSGELTVNDVLLGAGDGAAITGESAIRFRGLKKNAEFLLFDLR